MSVHTQHRRLTIPDLKGFKGHKKIVALTAYSAPIARLLDGLVDLILIGDSTAMVLYNHADTLSITLEQMAAHGRAVVSSTSHACVAIDMPFGSYQESPQQAYRNCVRMMQLSGASVVKLEGGIEMSETIAFLVQRGIPVIAHIGLMPQHVNVMGGFKAQGKDTVLADSIYEAALAHEQAGASIVLMEGTVQPLASRITKELKVPTIGIGASPDCDGQILVTEDILGLSGDHPPKFSKQYADVGAVIKQAVGDYADDVRNNQFPELRHCFGVPKNESH